LTPDIVNSADGRWLHNFGWVTDKTSIGSMPESWNFIPDHSEKNTGLINAIHYTEGVPLMKPYRNCRYASLWVDEYNLMRCEDALMKTAEEVMDDVKD
jgi:hypothetical protein